MADDPQLDLIALTAEITASYVAHNRVGGGEVAGLIASVHAALRGLGAAPTPEEPAKPTGAVSARKSIADPNHILSMIDGKPYRTLARHIGRHGYTPDTYRAAFGLPVSYPMVARACSIVRSELAKARGFGRKPGTKGAAKVDGAVAPKRRGRKPGALGTALAAAKTHLQG